MVNAAFVAVAGSRLDHERQILEVLERCGHPVGIVTKSALVLRDLDILARMAERNLAMSCIIISCAYAVLYANSFSLPNMLQALFGYDAYRAGLVLSPGGITSISASTPSLGNAL